MFRYKISRGTGNFTQVGNTAHYTSVNRLFWYLLKRSGDGRGRGDAGKVIGKRGSPYPTACTCGILKKIGDAVKYIGEAIDKGMM